MVGDVKKKSFLIVLCALEMAELLECFMWSVLGVGSYELGFHHLNSKFNFLKFFMDV